MRLTALSVCGTLLAFFSLFWTTADSEEGDLLGNHEFGPCAATLRPEGPCGQGQDGSTCPYLFSLPPLTFHFPKQLRELEKIVEDLQELKDNVDQLRKMCADCTVSQTERECGRQRESEYYDVNEGTGRHKDERDWLNEREPEGVKNVSLRCRADGVKAEKSIERDADIDSEKRKNLEEKERNKWDAERGSDKIVVKDNEKEVAEEDGKTQTDEAKGKDKPGQPKVPASSENERPGDMGKKKVVDKYNRETMTDVSKDGEENSKPNPEGMLERGKERMITSNIKNKEKIEDSEHYVWRNETKETDKRTQTEEDRGSDGTKMSEGRNEHTNKEREQHREERRKEMEKGIKVERNNEKPKQTESIGRAEKERTIKEGAVEEDREMGKEIKTEGEKTVQSLQRDGDGDLESSKSTEGTDFVSISPTDSIISAAPRHDSMDLNEVVTITSPLPPPPVSSSTPHLITDVDQGKTITADRPTLSTGFQAGDISEQTSPDAEAGLRNTRRPPTAATISAEGGPRQRRPSITTWSTSKTRTWLGSSDQGWVKSTTTTTSTTTPHQSLNTTTSPGVSDHSRWAARTNTSSHAKTGVKPLPGQAPKPSGRIKPEADQRLKNPKIARKPDQGLLPDESIKSDQTKKLYRKPTTDQKSKTSKDPVWVHQQKPEQTPSSDNSPTDKNLPNFQIPKHDHENTTDGNQTPPQKTKTHPKSLSPVHRPTSDQRSGTENITGSHKDPLTDQDPPSVVQRTDHDLKPNKKLVHPIKTDKPDQKKKSHEEPENEEKPDQRSTSNPLFSPEEPERRETTSLTSNPHQKPLTKSTGSSDEDPLPGTRTIKDTAPGKTPDRSPVKPSNQRPRPSQKIPKINQKPKPGQASKPNPKNPKPVTGQKTKPNVKPKPDQTQTNPRLKTPQPDQMPNPDTKTLPEENKTSSPPRYRTPTRPTVESGETPAEMPKAAVQPKPSPKIKTDPPKISGAFTDGIQNSQTDLPPASGHEVPHSPADTKLKSKNQDYNIKTTTQGPKTSNSLKTEHFPHLTSHPEGFTMSPNSRITSDLRPKTASQPPSIEMTTRLNKIMRGILPSVVTSTGPESTKPNQASKTDSGPTPHPDKMLVPGPSPITQTTSTTTSDLRSTTPATSALEYPADESTTPSARELRVKINQVAAFLNNSLSPNKGPDRRPTEHPEDSSRSDRTDGKQPTLKQSKVNLVRRDCSDHLLRGGTKSGVYVVTPDLRGRSFPVFCDMEQEGGGWTLLQSRQDGSVSFNRSWAEYRVGFGEINRGEFWLGNNMIHLLTRDRDMVLRVELEDFNGVTEYAEYEHFRVANERMRYRLTVGGYSGTAGDALRFSKTYDHNNRAFTTPDRDHDRYPSGNCGAYYSSGWWFDACMAANLNGRYYVGKYKGVRDGIFWGTWHNISTEYYPTNDRQSFKTVRMMIRPKGFTTRAGL